MTDIDPLSGKVVLIVGAGRPLGRVLALGFARAGARLALHDLSPVHLDETMEQVKALGAECRNYTGDIGKGMPCRALISDVLEYWQQLDVLVTCLHASPPAGLLELDEWDWTRTLELNLTGPFLLAQAAAPAMMERGGGSMVFVQSGHPQAMALAASQGGLSSLAQAAAEELRAYNIYCFTIDAGDCEGWSRPEDVENSRKVALQELAVSLCRPEAAGWTGQTLRLEGNG
jgi:NAD(P)-dependent dehydrogenase (short-subunit alcohol dehydrogenase family)